jgi:myosin-7
VAKAIYDKLFSYLVAFINSKTKTTESAQNFIGVLDIFGFELFEVRRIGNVCASALFYF